MLTDLEYGGSLVLSGQTNRAWSELAREFDGLNRAEPGEIAARAMLDRARAFSEFCAGFWAEPIKFKNAPAAPAADGVASP